jgi:hypothetical protein
MAGALGKEAEAEQPALQVIVLVSQPMIHIRRQLSLRGHPQTHTHGLTGILHHDGVMRCLGLWASFLLPDKPFVPAIDLLHL